MIVNLNFQHPTLYNPFLVYCETLKSRKNNEGRLSKKRDRLVKLHIEYKKRTYTEAPNKTTIVYISTRVETMKQKKKQLIGLN